MITEPDDDAAAAPRWVSVPVPQHLLEQVNVFVLNLSLAGTPYAWHLEAMAEHLGALDETGRRLVTLVAESMLVGAPLTALELAQRLDVSVNEVFGILHLANSASSGSARPYLIWISKPTTESPDTDGVFMMADPLVDLVIEIDRGQPPASSTLPTDPVLGRE